MVIIMFDSDVDSCGGLIVMMVMIITIITFYICQEHCNKYCNK